MKTDWRRLAAGMLDIERQMRPYHLPPSTPCLVTWRDRTLVGMVQHPVSEKWPALVILSVTSKYFDPEFVRMVRNFDPGRLELAADEALDLQGNFHVLRREDRRLTLMTPEELAFAQALWADWTLLVQVQPPDELRRQAQTTPKSIRCPRCGRRSYNPIDVEQRYCGACHRFQEGP